MRGLQSINYLPDVVRRCKKHLAAVDLTTSRTYTKALSMQPNTFRQTLLLGQRASANNTTYRSILSHSLQSPDGSMPRAGILHFL